MKKTICLFILLLLLPLTIADPSYYYKINTKTDMVISCFTSTYEYCDGTTLCTATVRYPNHTVMLNNITLSYSESYFNYTIGSEDLNVVGTYYAVTNCKGVTNGFSTFTFMVTRGGEEPKNVLPVVLSMTIIALALIGIGLYLFFKSKGEDD